jgi:glutathione S-transferase
MIHLHQLPNLEGKNYSCSPFCVKLELYLKAMNIAYDNSFSLELNKSPTGKMPFIETQGKKIADSNIIIKYLEQENDQSLDSHLSCHQSAISLAFMRLCEDSLYWIAVYSRWVDIDNKSWKKEFMASAKLPKMMSGIVYNAAKRNITRQLKASGILVLSQREIYAKAEQDLKALADFLDGRKHFFNDNISLLDITVYSFIVQLLDNSCSKKIQSILEGLNFSDFIDNMRGFLSFEK